MMPGNKSNSTSGAQKEGHSSENGKTQTGQKDAITGPPKATQGDAEVNKHGRSHKDKTEKHSREKTPSNGDDSATNQRQMDVLLSSMATMAQSVSGMSENMKNMSENMNSGIEQLTQVCQDMQQSLGYEEGEWPEEAHSDSEDRARPIHQVSDSEDEGDKSLSLSALQNLGKPATTAGTSTASKSSTSVTDLLAELKKQVDCEEETGPGIQTQLAEIVTSMCQNGLTDKEQKEKMEALLRPENCEMLQPTRVNPMIWDKLSPGTRSADIKIQQVQKLLVKGVIPLVNMADAVLKALTDKGSLPATQDLFSGLTTSLGLLILSNYTLNMRRRELIIPDMHQDYQALKSAKKVPLTTQLFGDDLEKTIDDIAKANRVGKKVDRKRKFGDAFPAQSGFHAARKSSYYGQQGQRGAFRGQRRGRGYFQRGSFLGQRPPYRPPHQQKKEGGGERKKD